MEPLRWRTINLFFLLHIRRLVCTGSCLLLLLTAFYLLSSCQGNSQQGEVSGDSSLIINSVHARTLDESNATIHTSRENAITRAVAKVSQAVVGITVVQVQRFVRRNPFDDPLWRSLFPELYRDRVYERKIESLGSGFLISPDGYIVTNEHVVENATEIVVTMTNGHRYNAELVGEDPLTDIALLKIDGDEDFPFIEFGSSTDLLVGEWVIALGNPFGLFALNDKPTVTVGVVSATDRDWGRTEDGRLYMDMIQTDAAINHGNSGGPLVNALGQVIGMNTFIYTGSQYQQGFVGIGFAIPIDKVKEIIAELKENGSINRNFWVGILDVQTLNPIIVSVLKLKVDKGVIITHIDPHSPAYRAGLREEDVITAINGKPIRTREDYIQTIREMDLKVGDMLTFTVYRNEKKYSVDITLEPAPRIR